MIANRQIAERIKKSNTFKQEMDKADHHYKSLCQQAHYSDLSTIEQKLISKYDQHKNPFDVYFFYSMFQEKGPKTILYFVQKIPRPNKSYTIVYFNEGQPNHLFDDFKSMLSLMPYEYFVHLEQIVLLKASFRNRASGILSFGTVTRFINSKIHCYEGLDELCDNFGFKIQDLHSFLPTTVKDIFINKEEDEKILLLKKILSTAETKKSQPQITNKKKQIEEYNLGNRGVPEIFDMLIYYFQHHEEGLNAEGLFRKSVSIIDEEDALEKLNKGNYNFLQKVQNPHLPANLMKRFLAKLNTPIIPYQLFNQFINRKTFPVDYLKDKMRELHSTYRTRFLTLVSLLQFFVYQVIPRRQSNLMTVQNVGICIAPCIMWAEERSIKDIVYSTLAINVLNELIINFEAIFGDNKAQYKLFRGSFLTQKKKSLHESLSSYESNRNSKEPEIKTPQFKEALLQNTFSFIQSLKEESDEDIPQPQIQQIKPTIVKNKNVFKSELTKMEKSTQQPILYSQKQTKQKIEIEQEEEQMEVSEHKKHLLKPEVKKRKGIFNTQWEDRKKGGRSANKSGE